jgi:hypothetical protein
VGLGEFWVSRFSRKLKMECGEFQGVIQYIRTLRRIVLQWGQAHVTYELPPPVGRKIYPSEIFSSTFPNLDHILRTTSPPPRRTKNLPLGNF